jgi:hypothetical protein
MNAIFFCVARKIFLPRHAVIFSMPCTRRGVKEILLSGKKMSSIIEIEIE